MSDERSVDDGELVARLRGALREIGADVRHTLPATSDRPGPSASRRRVSGLLVPLVSTVAVLAVVGGIGLSVPNIGAESDLQPPVVEGPTSAPTPGPVPSAAPGGRGAVDRLSERLSQRWREPGFGKIEIDYQHATVRVYWHGDPPPGIEILRDRTVDGVALEVIGIPYSEAQLAAAGRRVLQYSRAAVIEVSHALPAQDFAALVVAVVGPEDAFDRDALEETMAEVARVPVAIEFVEDGFVDGVLTDSSSTNF